MTYQDTLCIRRAIVGATEDVTFDDFTLDVIQDEEDAFLIGRRMLAAPDEIYVFNEDEPEYREHFTVINELALRSALRYRTLTIEVDERGAQDSWSGIANAIEAAGGAVPKWLTHCKDDRKNDWCAVYETREDAERGMADEMEGEGGWYPHALIDLDNPEDAYRVRYTVTVTTHKRGDEVHG